VDYKSNRLDGQEPADITEASYSTQRLVYALAALRAGAAEVEVAYVFLERPGEPVSSVYAAADTPALESELLGLAGGVVEGRFEPTARPHRALCAGCPGRAALCSWDETHTLAEEPPA
jgi:ATP-dependent helicase/nuclease subunit A